jgi:hypothetical protein
MMVTCLLEEPTGAPFLTPSGRIAPPVVASFLGGRDYGEGVPVPAALLADGCPPEVWSFLSDTGDMWPYC